ncbi:MAG: aldo/keto reductase [Promethearchaeota archaeon]|nr:MAG: aldo/keto reductase [Candidatus Lokiarchaeota archaeon]
MHYNKLGNTEFKVSQIGLGTEYLFHQPKEIVVKVIQEAVKSGINYFDILFSVQSYLKKLSNAIKGYRNKIIIAGHIGTKEVEGRARKTRSVKEAKESFLKLLSTLNIDYVDILMIQFVTLKEYDVIIKADDLLDLALLFKDQGKTKYIGMSTHDITVAMKVINNKDFSALMVPLNIANHTLKDRDNLLNKCSAKNFGLIAIKPFAGGKLLQKNRTVNFAKYQTAGLTLKKKVPSDISSLKCLNYVTSLPGVNMTLMGVKNIVELQENLKYFQTSKAEMNYETIIPTFAT